jgi:hypothetical protein
MDAYLYMRFLKMLVKLSFVGAIITWPILFPVNATGGGGESGLDIISFSNVNSPTRYFAHAVVAWIFFGWTMFLIVRETLYLVKIRQAYLLSTWQASRISQRTVLFTNVPEKQLSLESIHTMFSGVAQVWLVPDIKDLEDDVQELEETVPKLEKSEIKFMTKVNKKQKKSGGEKDVSHDSKLRPTHRTKFLVGKKVDSIEHYRQEINELLPKIKSAQRSHIAGKEKLLSAVFIEFDTLADAQHAATQHEHRWPTKETETRQMGVLPEEIIWDNLGMGSKTRFIKKVLATLAISLLILFWAIPVAIVGIISNVSYLTENVPFLAWIDSIPPVILGVVTGLLPTILLAVLMALVPVICRCKFLPFPFSDKIHNLTTRKLPVFAKLAGAPTQSAVELQTQSWYFAFQVIQVFLVTTFTSGATAVASQIVSDPTQAIPLLSKNLPKASNFYIAYFILFGVANASRYLFSLIGLLGILVLSKFDKTPRKKYLRYVSLMEPSWGAEYPKWTNLGVIAISYAVIAPLVLGFATVGLGLLYVAYRYNMFYVYNTRIDTKGAFYARALGQLMVGVYLGELCLLGLFGIGIGSELTAIGPVVMQVVLIVATIVFHIVLKRKVAPQVKRLPLEEPSHSQHGTDVERGGQRIVSNVLSDSEHRNHEAIGPMSHSLDARAKQPFYTRIFTMRQCSVAQITASLAPHFKHPVPDYTKQEVLEAYLHPALIAPEPVVWLARDPAGVSRKECDELRQSIDGVEVTDQGAVMNEKGKVEWIDESVVDAPLWERSVVY